MPTLAASRRRIRTHALWKVITHIARARGPTSCSTRSRISAAALLVKVIASTWPGWTPRAASRCAIRCVSTRVLPDPAPATMSSGLPSWRTASRCSGLRPSRRASGLVAPHAAVCRAAPSAGPSPEPWRAQSGTPAALTIAACALVRVASSTWGSSPKCRPSNKVLMSRSTLRPTTDRDVAPRHTPNSVGCTHNLTGQNPAERIHAPATVVPPTSRRHRHHRPRPRAGPRDGLPGGRRQACSRPLRPRRQGEGQGCGDHQGGLPRRPDDGRHARQRPHQPRRLERPQRARDDQPDRCARHPDRRLLTDTSTTNANNGWQHDSKFVLRGGLDGRPPAVAARREQHSC
jgi:hypothetical protein